MFKVKNRNTTTRTDLWPKLTIKTPEQRKFNQILIVRALMFQTSSEVTKKVAPSHLVVFLGNDTKKRFLNN